MKRIGRMMKITYLSLKSGGKIYFAPHIVMLIVSYLVWRYIEICKGGIEGYIGANGVLQQTIPFLSVLWMFIIMHEVLDEDGAELMHYYDRNYLRTYMVCVFVFGWYVAHVIIFSFLLNLLMPYMVWIFLQIVMQSAFLSGAFMLFSVISKKTPVAFLMVILYYLAMAFMDVGSRPALKAVSIFDIGVLADKSVFLDHSIWVGLIGAGMWIIAAGILLGGELT